MALYTASLNTGSNGNCFYVGNDADAILIDAGLSCKETEIRMLRMGLSMEKVRAIFISHEHGDHTRGLKVLSKKYQLPVYINQSTLQNSRVRIESHLIKDFKADLAESIGQLQVMPFEKHHDAAHPHSFTITHNGISVGVFTDIGAQCERLINQFKRCHAAYLETNYDEDMLANGNYPFHLKRRISGGKGHLSNREAFELFKAHKPSFMTHLFLSHLSKDNNSPMLVNDLFNSINVDGINVEIIVASREKETGVYQIGVA